jgi:hypothetical protein
MPPHAVLSRRAILHGSAILRGPWVFQLPHGSFIFRGPWVTLFRLLNTCNGWFVISESVVSLPVWNQSGSSKFFIQNCQNTRWWEVPSVKLHCWQWQTFSNGVISWQEPYPVKCKVLTDRIVYWELFVWHPGIHGSYIWDWYEHWYGSVLIANPWC